MSRVESRKSKKLTLSQCKSMTLGRVLKNNILTNESLYIISDFLDIESIDFEKFKNDPLLTIDDEEGNWKVSEVIDHILTLLNSKESSSYSYIRIIITEFGFSKSYSHLTDFSKYPNDLAISQALKGFYDLIFSSKETLTKGQLICVNDLIEENKDKILNVVNDDLLYDNEDNYINFLPDTCIVIIIDELCFEELVRLYQAFPIIRTLSNTPMILYNLMNKYGLPPINTFSDFY